MTSTTEQGIVENYTSNDMLARIKMALEQAGFGTAPVKWSEVTGVDQLHVRGTEATRELAAALSLQPGQKLLDVGSGLGGPARYLAAEHQVHVTGIDITPAFVEIASFLSARCGMEQHTLFQQGDATHMPFEAAQFDLAFTQHVSMNIADKRKLFQEIWRVLKPGGTLAIYDAIKGNDQAVTYPTPWARDESISFLSTENEVRQDLSQAGFNISSFIDKTELAKAWFQELMQRLQQSPPAAAAPNPLSPMAIFGPELGQAIGNFARNVMDGRVRIVQILAGKV